MSEYKSFNVVSPGTSKRRELGVYKSLKYHKCKVINGNLPKKQQLTLVMLLFKG